MKRKRFIKVLVVAIVATVLAGCGFLKDEFYAPKDVTATTSSN
jgi:predicted small lipoprotein YifL